jgi:uncharacterized membrane protein
MKYKFNIEEVFAQAWTLTKKHFWLMLGVGAVTMIISYTIEGIKYLFLAGSKEMGFMYLPYAVFLVVGFAASLILGFNTYRMIFDMVDGKSTKIMDLFKWDNTISSRLGKWLVANFVLGFIIFIGFILLIVPGIYLAIRYAYVNMLLIEKDITIKEAFKKSSDMTQGEKWHLIGMFLVCAIVVMIGLILLVIGLVPAVMIVTFASVLVYRKLESHTHHKVETV